eukprot:scaffold20093_cov63-Phaeocystis_antarctica.AAC.4
MTATNTSLVCTPLTMPFSERSSASLSSHTFAPPALSRLASICTAPSLPSSCLYEMKYERPRLVRLWTNRPRVSIGKSATAASPIQVPNKCTLMRDAMACGLAAGRPSMSIGNWSSVRQRSQRKMMQRQSTSSRMSKVYGASFP